MLVGEGQASWRVRISAVLRVNFRIWGLEGFYERPLGSGFIQLGLIIALGYLKTQSILLCKYCRKLPLNTATEDGRGESVGECFICPCVEGWGRVSQEQCRHRRSDCFLALAVFFCFFTVST